MNIEARKGEPYGALLRQRTTCEGRPRPLVLDSCAAAAAGHRSAAFWGTTTPTGSVVSRTGSATAPFDLSVLVDGQSGGDIFSVTNWFGEYAGVLESSLRGREEDFCTPGIMVDGVLPDGSINGDGVDDVTVCPQSYFGRNYGNQEASIDDATYVKLREVRLGYELPSVVDGPVGLLQRQRCPDRAEPVPVGSEHRQHRSRDRLRRQQRSGHRVRAVPTARSIGLSFTITP